MMEDMNVSSVLVVRHICTIDCILIGVCLSVYVNRANIIYYFYHTFCLSVFYCINILRFFRGCQSFLLSQYFTLFQTQSDFKQVCVNYFLNLYCLRFVDRTCKFSILMLVGRQGLLIYYAFDVVRNFILKLNRLYNVSDIVRCRVDYIFKFRDTGFIQYLFLQQQGFVLVLVFGLTYYCIIINLQKCAIYFFQPQSCRTWL
eukprot:TRINITY_DN34527_c0_g1_i2.p2 TRINITY_DN34527_c0_g1~~TRINITY_DN34527_c0_g1_i2.p2  ORF type:complete len:201 (-),score=-15.89 TRINITY_DN34527_c0_g1_i2:155-757(-)